MIPGKKRPEGTQTPYVVQKKTYQMAIKPEISWKVVFNSLFIMARIVPPSVLKSKEAIGL